MSSSQPFIILVAAAVIANSSHIATNSHAGKTSALLDAMESLESPCDFDCCQCARESYPKFGGEGTRCKSCHGWVQDYVVPEYQKHCVQERPCQIQLHLRPPYRFEPMAGLGPREWNPLTANWVFADPLLHKVKSHMMNDSYAVAPQRSIAYQAVRNIIQNEREDEGLSSFNNLNSPMKRHVSN
mmetsp:Transcript_29605/g.50204  ORF Transcript_29605/g.50204 Transcript_29605/m.50204 type:complete len:184 (-) Transcript_29605:48-599(-)